jgi:pentatricopeptide repeat protein
MTIFSIVASIVIIGRFKGPASVGFGVQGITPWEYLLTQFRAMVLYIRLLFLPVNQNLDYAFEPSRSLFEVGTALSFLLLLVIAVIALAGMRKWKIASFFILWFFIILAPTSSVLPIVDPVFEHRVYLASAGIFAIAAYALARAFREPRALNRNAAYVFLALLIIVLAGATYERNRVWASSVALWEDVARKSPLKSRVHYNLGNAYRSKGMLDEAIEQYSISVQLDQKKSNAYNNLANSYIMQGRYNEAVEVYRKAIDADEKNYEAYYNLGVTLKRMGRHGEARSYLAEFVGLAPARLRPHRERAIKLIKELDAWN